MILSLVLAIFGLASAQAWDDHGKLTRLSLSEQQDLGAGDYEPLSSVFDSLGIAREKGEEGLPAEKVLARFLKIRGEKVKWDWNPDVTGKPLTAIEVLSFSADEADAGMDQELDLGPDQDYMGGKTGLSSQGIRHMYYRGWKLKEPIKTFHFPMHELGLAPERAQTYFDLAVRAQDAGHSFWAYRFLGFGLHYVQDLTQPYHSSQFASLRLLPLGTLVSKGWKPFVAEATRLVANFHLTFEEHVAERVRAGDPTLIAAFSLPIGGEATRMRLAGDASLSALEGTKLVAAESSRLAPALARQEDKLIGKQLRAPGLEIRDGFRDANGKPKVDLSPLDPSSARTDAQRKSIEAFRALTGEAFSSIGAATRWYLEMFQRETGARQPGSTKR